MTLPHDLPATGRAAMAFLREGDAPLLVVPVGAGASEARMREEVAASLATPGARWLSPTFFYDRAGSELYEAITALPEYYPTRTEASLLERHAPEIAACAEARVLFELGSGSATKTRLLLAAMLKRRRPLTYAAVDVSGDMLEESARALVARFPDLRVLGLAGRFEEAFATLEPLAGALVVFLGGTLGNFPPAYQARFFAGVREVMAPGSHLLLGFDRQAHAGKPAELIRRAYDDAAGVTARFNLNALAHLNRVLGSDFALAAWTHVAVYNEASHQIEMYLESRTPQRVHLWPGGPMLQIQAGERILTEISRKFDPDTLAEWFEARGFACEQRWEDEANWFGLMLLKRL